MKTALFLSSVGFVLGVVALLIDYTPGQLVFLALSITLAVLATKVADGLEGDD